MLRVLWNEMKKIWTWKMLGLLFIVNLILFFLVIEFEIEYFPNGRPELDSYRIGIEMIEKYGTEMDEEEIVDFKMVYEEEMEKADRYLQARPEFVEVGWDTYEKYKAYNPFEHPEERKEELDFQLMHEEQVDLFWELQERERLIGFHDEKEAGFERLIANAPEAQSARYVELLENGMFQLYPEVAIRNFDRFIEGVASTILISVLLVVSPIFLQDRNRRLLDLQYTTEKGRALYRTKVLAGALSTFWVVTGLLAVYFGFYAQNKTTPYFDVPIHMFVGRWYWYDPTFFQYIVLCTIGIYMLSFVFVFLAMGFSTIMPNYVTLIGIQIPLVIWMIGDGFNRLLTGMIDLWQAKWFVPTMYIALMIVSVGLMVYLSKREKKRDILM